MSKNVPTAQPRKRGRPAKSANPGLRPDDTTANRPAKPGQSKVKPAYKVFLMHAAERLDFVSVTNGDDYTRLYMCIEKEEWQALISGNAFYSMVERSFRKRNSGARHIASFVKLEDVTLPINHVSVTTSDNAQQRQHELVNNGNDSDSQP